MQRQNMRGEYRVGPGASSLLLIFVAVCLTTVGILTLISAVADSRMSDRSEEHITAYYEAATRAQREIGVLDGQLAGARALARGDQFAYQYAVKELAGDQIPLQINQAEGDNMIITFQVPMEADNYLEVDLLVPMRFDGPRYEVVRHIAVNAAEWNPDDSIDLFGEGDGLLFADDEDDDSDAEVITDDETEEPEAPGLIGAGEIIQAPTEGE